MTRACFPATIVKEDSTIRLSRTSLSSAQQSNNQDQNVAFTVDGNQLATTRLGIVRLWDVGTGRLLGGWSGTTENFVRIGHSLFALTVGWLGGQLSCRLRRASSTPEVLTAVGVEGTNP